MKVESTSGGNRKLMKVDSVGREVKNDQILVDVNCERSLTNSKLISN